jgi:hypothetical protein
VDGGVIVETPVRWVNTNWMGFEIVNHWVSSKRYHQLAVTGSMLTTILPSAVI